MTGRSVGRNETRFKEIHKSGTRVLYNKVTVEIGVD